jgi:protein TonB
VPVDVSDSFALEEMPSAPLDDARVEPIPASVAPAPSGPAPPETVADPPPPRARDRTITPGLFVSLALHLSPLLLLVSWSSAPADIPPPPIQVQVVFEPPPPAAGPEKIPPRGPLASEDRGPTRNPAAKPAPQVAPELMTALAPPEPPPELLPRPEALLELPPPIPKPAPKPPVRRSDSTVHIAGPSGWQVLGQLATGDEYLALLKRLTQRHLYLLPPSLLAGRRGATALSILILGDGTIARIAIARSSGYPDIDERVEKVVAAVGRFPPLPPRFQEASLEVIMHLQFPEALER